MKLSKLTQGLDQGGPEQQHSQHNGEWQYLTINHG